jgi:c(7)-type cytochrome triheme protein
MRFMLSAVTMMITVATASFATVGGGDVTLKSKGGDVVFSHDSHVGDVKLSCTECHNKPYLNKTVTMKQMQQGKSCGVCHNGKKAFSVKVDCAKCHKK